MVWFMYMIVNTLHKDDKNVIIIIIIIIIPNHTPDIVIRDNEKGTCTLIHVAT